jgi:hypothetical protein
MAISNGYATLAEFKTLVGTSSATDDTFMEDCIEAASRYIDGQTTRTFYARTETRYYDVPPNASRLLELDDDLLTITTLTNGDSNTIASSEYNLIPKNFTPKRAIKLKASSSTYWDFDSDGNSEFVISIAGTWGYVATRPDDINLACLDIANGIYKRRHGENVSSVATITAAGVVVTPRDVSGMAARTIRRYQKWV